MTPSPPPALRESPAAREAARRGFQQLRGWGPECAPQSGSGALLIPRGPLLSRVALPVGTATAAAPRDDGTRDLWVWGNLTHEPRHL